MIVTLTPNTGIDYTFKVPQFALGKTIRAYESAWGMGGKAADAAWILGKLGVPTAALGFAAGKNGSRMEAMLQDHGVLTDFVQVQGETRLNTVIVSPGKGQSTFTSSSLLVTAAQSDELLRKFDQSLDEAECAVIGGSLPSGTPAGFYQRLIHAAKQRNIPVIFDASGPALASGLKACPAVIKPNRTELEELLGCKIASTAEAVQAAVSLAETYGTSVIVTMGDEGAVAVLGGQCFLISPLNVPVESTAGAGDGVLAGMALAYYQKESLVQGLRYGFALAGAVVQTLATADFNKDEYQRLLAAVNIQAFEPG